MARRRILGYRTCARPGCDRPFEVYARNADQVECGPHIRGSKNSANTKQRNEDAKNLREGIRQEILGDLRDPGYEDWVARSRMRLVSLDPTVPYLGFRDPWPSRCVFCVRAMHPTMQEVDRFIRDYGERRNPRFCSCRGLRQNLEIL